LMNVSSRWPEEFYYIYANGFQLYLFWRKII